MSESPNPGSEHNLPEFSVSELSAALKRTVEQAYGHVRVRGEISGFKRAASGHLYMTLKDDQAVLDAVCWRGTAGRLGVAPEDGIEVICTGRLTTYAGRSKYQIVVEAMEIAGEGALLKLLEDRRKKLAAEGLFDADRKREIPFLPTVIGVVTSPTGAVIRDILHRLSDRFPRHVLLWPVLVQGDGAAAQIAGAIDGFNRLAADGPVPRPDLLIVARGGGSLEDLWAFNEEIVVRAAAASDIPLISAVGHETDTTLIDFAADLRAPTPTAAAEMAVPVRVDLLAQLLDDGKRLIAGVGRMLEERRLRLDGLARGLPEPRTLLESVTQRLDFAIENLKNRVAGFLRDREQALARQVAGLRPGALRREMTMREERLVGLTERLPPAFQRAFDLKRNEFEKWGALLESYSYARVLDRGFVVVRDAANEPVISVAAASPGLPVSLEFSDGRAAAVIGSAETPAPRRAKPARKTKAPVQDDDQGSLL